MPGADRDDRTPARRESTTGKRCVLTLDLENNWAPDDPALDYETFEHLSAFVDLLDDRDVPLTVFVVGRVLEERPDAVATLRDALPAEFHLHSYAHDLSGDVEFAADLARGVDAYRAYFGDDPTGYRAPMGRITPAERRHLEEEGFAFDASVFPTLRPGVYNNLHAPLEPHVPEDCTSLVELPVGAVPYCRLPVTQSYLKLLGRPYLRALEYLPLPSVLTVVVHLQDLYRVAMHDRLSQPLRAVHGRNLDRSVALFEGLLDAVERRGYEFVRATDVVEAVRPR